MENRFAGAQNQGERRRRRLSHDDSEDLQSEGTREFGEINESPRVGPPIQESIFRRLISPRLWKSASIIFATSAIVGLVIWNSREQTTVFESVTATTGLADRLAGLLLLAAGQLAVIIGWIRSTSQVDFKGRYRVWKWLGLALCSVGAVLVLQIGGLIPNLLTSAVERMTGPIQAARPAILFAVGATISVIVMARVIPDMGRCYSSQAILVAGVLATLVRMMLVYGSSSSVSEATLDALTLMAADCAFASMLLHCRFVAFVNNDPPVVSTRASASKQGSRHGSESVDDLEPEGSAAPTTTDSKSPSDEKEASKPAPAKPAKKKRRASRRKAA